MDEIKESKKPIPPYVAYKTFINVLERLRVGIPNRIDRSVLGTFSGATQGQLFATLKFLSLISQQGIPTDKLAGLVNSEGAEREKILREILVAAYPFLFRDEIDLKGLTAKQLHELFEQAGSSGETTKRCIAFFMAAAKNSGIELSPYLGKIKSQGSRNGAVRPRRAITERKSCSSAIPDQSTEIRSEGGDIGWQQLLLSKFPAFDPAWPDEVKTKWFEAFRDLMGEFKKQ